MNNIENIDTDETRRQRVLMLDEEEKQKLKEEEQKRKNHGFTQVYDKGWDKLQELLKTHPRAASLYAFFAQNIEPSCGAVTCDQSFLGNHFNVSTRTIRTWIKVLEDNNAIIKIPLAGRMSAYALNPEEVWKGYNNRKGYAAFKTKTLVNKDGEIIKKLKIMLKNNEEK